MIKGITTYPISTNAYKVCENEMRYVILKKNILKLLTRVKEKPRNKCITRKESTFKNESQALRNELQETFKNELKQTNESQTPINESQALRIESQETVKNESHQTNESRKTFNNESLAFRKNQHKKND